MTRAEASDPELRMKSALESLKSEICLSSQIIVPDAASPVRICADIRKRALTLEMKLKAPDDRKSSKARLSWLIRQLSEAETKDLHIRMFWPGRSSATQFSLAALRENPELATKDHDGMVVLSFEVVLVRDLGSKFTQRKNFVAELVRSVSDFYSNVGANLTNWQAKPPKISTDKLEPESVSTEAMRDQVEQEALHRTGSSEWLESYPLDSIADDTPSYLSVI